MHSSPSVVGTALSAAVRVPLPWHTQPWLLEVDGDQIRLLLNRGNLDPAADPGLRQARLSCGAALANLRIALRAHDRVGYTDLLPDGDHHDLLAVVKVAGDRVATSTERRLCDAIGGLQVTNVPYLDRAVPQAARAALASAAHTEGAGLMFVDTAERYGRLVRLIQATDARRDNGATDRLLPIAPRLTERQPSLVAVLTPAEGPRHDLLAGAGMQRALLTATVLGLSASFVTGPLDEPAARQALSSELRGFGVVHMLLRVGYRQPVIAGPRLPADDEVSGHLQ